MISIPIKRIYNSYIIETYNYDEIKKSINEFAIKIGFDSRLIESENHPDISYIEIPDKNIPIDLVRSNVIETAIYTPKVASRKIYVIYDSINLEDNVQNALLKTLEEPPSFDVFFLVTSNSSKLLETIRSRCILIKDNDEFNYKKFLEYDFINDAIYLISNAKYLSKSEKMQFAYDFTYNNQSLTELIRFYRFFLRDALLYKITLSKNSLYIRELEDGIINFANEYSKKEIGRLIESLNLLLDANKNNVNKKIALFNFFEV